jgi:hypothetical protein
MAHLVPKSRRQEWLQPGWQDMEFSVPYGVAGSPTQINPTTIAEAAKKVGVSGAQTSSLYGIGD